MNETNERRTPFYLVWREGRALPDYFHGDKQSAVDEASRLASNNPGETLHVLMVIKSAVVNPVTWIDYEGSDNPAPPF